MSFASAFSFSLAAHHALALCLNRLGRVATNNPSISTASPNDGIASVPISIRSIETVISAAMPAVAV